VWMDGVGRISQSCICIMTNNSYCMWQPYALPYNGCSQPEGRISDACLTSSFSHLAEFFGVFRRVKLNGWLRTLQGPQAQLIS
jgi:hypothetical protein